MLLGSAAPRHDILTVWPPPPVASVHNSQMMSVGNQSVTNTWHFITREMLHHPGASLSEELIK